METREVPAILARTVTTSEDMSSTVSGSNQKTEYEEFGGHTNSNDDTLPNSAGNHSQIGIHRIKSTFQELTARLNTE